MSTLKYEEESEEDVIELIFKLGILLKRSRLFTATLTNQQLLKEVQDAIQN